MTQGTSWKAADPPWPPRVAVNMWRLIVAQWRAVLDKPPIVSTPSQPRPAKTLEDKLWGGFARYALKELESLKQSSSVERGHVSSAALALAYWHAAEGDLQRACENAIMARQASATRTASLAQILLEAYCLVRTGQSENARALVSRAMERWPDDPNLCLAMANTYTVPDISGDPATDDIRLSWINRLYEKAGLLAIAKADPSRGLTLDNLAAAPHSLRPANGHAKVSIIIPVYNAQDTLPNTLKGLLAQTWQNIEIIVVDDCSSDVTSEVVEQFAKQDPRIALVRQARNQGSYCARNKGLEIATGEFITVHDAGDWSHPQKIELQAKHLLNNIGEIANYSRMARALENLLFVGKFRRKDRVIDWNPSSFFFRKTILEKIGGWDAVRISGDAELIRRATTCSVNKRIGSAFDSAPLSFTLDSESSLTRESATHGRTIYHGLRREYREASDHWRAASENKDVRIDTHSQPRPFPVPGPMLPNREERAICDTLFIADFNLGGEAFTSIVKQIGAAIARGQAVAVFHWRHYHLNVTEPLNHTIRQMAHDRKLRVIAPGESVRASTVVFASPSVLQHVVDLCPKIQFEQLIVGLDQGPDGAASGYGLYDPDVVRANLMDLFGTCGTWTPLSEGTGDAVDVGAARPATPPPPSTHTGSWTSPANLL